MKFNIPIGLEKLMFKKNSAPNMAFASAALIGLSACQMSIPVTGQTSSGQVATGSVIADLTDNNTLQFTIGASVNCTGLYNVINRSKFPVNCDNGLSGTAVVTPDGNDFDGVVDFKLSDGTSGRIVTKGAARSDNTAIVAKPEPQQPFLIRRIERNINSVGGASFSPWAVNTSVKTIKYINYKVTPYNAVGDVQSDSISGMSTKPLKDTGPYSNNQLILGGWTAWYNNTIRCFVIQSIKIEYMDGSILTYGNPAEVQKVMAPGLRNSCTA